MAEEAKSEIDPIEFGFDEKGYLRIKIHLTVGMWNMLGCLLEAQTRVMAQFGRLAKEEEKQKNKGLIRPEIFNGDQRWK